MKKSVKVTVAISLSLLLAGCATGTKLSESPVSSIPDGKGRIVIYRTSILGGAIQPAVNIDGVDTGKCKPGGAFIVDHAPGQVALSVETERTRTSYINVEEGKTSYVRCDPALGVVIWQVKLTDVPAEVGQSESAKLALMGSY